MSSPLRFLALAVLTWVGVRAAGGTLLPEPLAAIPLPPLQTPLLDAQVGSPSEPQAGVAYSPSHHAMPYPAMAPPAYAMATPRLQPIPVPFYYPAAAPHTRHAAAPALQPTSFDEQPWYGGDELALAGEWPQSRPPAPGTWRDAPLRPSSTPAATARFDRWALSSWALVRQPQASTLESRSPALSPTGTLGGSQAGLRLTYNLNRSLALNLRASGPADQKGLAGEAALGVSWQPRRSVPIRLLAERRHAVGEGAGRNAFALLAEGGLYARPLPWQLRLDGYAQAGVVGLKSRDLFADGGATVTRPLLGRFALGAGAWGGVQPGLSRVDIGPRLSLQLRPGIRAHLDYRYRLFGNAEPGSGPALTLAGDF